MHHTFGPVSYLRYASKHTTVFFFQEIVAKHTSIALVLGQVCLADSNAFSDAIVRVSSVGKRWSTYSSRRRLSCVKHCCSAVASASRNDAATIKNDVQRTAFIVHTSVQTIGQLRKIFPSTVHASQQKNKKKKNACCWKNTIFAKQTWLLLQTRCNEPVNTLKLKFQCKTFLLIVFIASVWNNNKILEFDSH